MYKRRVFALVLGLLLSLCLCAASAQADPTQLFLERYNAITSKYGFTVQAETQREETEDGAGLIVFEMPNQMLGRLAIQNGDIRAVFLQCQFDPASEQDMLDRAHALVQQGMWVMAALSDTPAFETYLFSAQLFSMGNPFSLGEERNWALSEFDVIASWEDADVYMLVLYRR